MSPSVAAGNTILVIGATGNTGQSVMRNLSQLLSTASTDSRPQIVGLTRALNTATSRELASLPFVKMIEKDWTTIDSAWLQTQRVSRAYVASHNLARHFVDESALHIALLHAGVKYVVKISTAPVFMGVTSPVYYGRAHLALEDLLSKPEFQSMQWTSLRPNVFTTSWLGPAVNWIQEFQKTGRQDHTLSMVPSGEVPAALIDPIDVGKIAAHLLALKDPAPHNRARYMLSGPEDVTGQDILKAVERITGAKVESVEYQSMTLINQLVNYGYGEHDLASIVAGLKLVWQGNSTLANTATSEELMQLSAPMLTFDDTLEAMLRN